VDAVGHLEAVERPPGGVPRREPAFEVGHVEPVSLRAARFDLDTDEQRDAVDLLV
jgi:hypothetical protein